MNHSIEFVEKELSKLQKINYNQFFWWRRWSVKNKPLPKNSPLMDKIKNGDYNFSPYFWQLQYCDWEIEQKRLKYLGDIERFCEETTMDFQRRKRLREDHEKYETENLAQLKKDFVSTFRMTKEDYDDEVIKVGGTVEDFYNHCEMRYRKYNRPDNMPKRGRPPKNKIK
jgi:hypothetical protein